MFRTTIYKSFLGRNEDKGSKQFHLIGLSVRLSSPHIQTDLLGLAFVFGDPFAKLRVSDFASHPLVVKPFGKNNGSEIAPVWNIFHQIILVVDLCCPLHYAFSQRVLNLLQPIWV